MFVLSIITVWQCGEEPLSGADICTLLPLQDSISDSLTRWSLCVISGPYAFIFVYFLVTMLRFSAPKKVKTA